MQLNNTEAIIEFPEQVFFDLLWEYVLLNINHEEGGVLIIQLPEKEIDIRLADYKESDRDEF